MTAFFIFLSLATLVQHRPLPKPHYPLPRTKLASLVKGEVPSPEKIRATTGGIATPTFRSALTFPKPHYPSKIANTLASLVKGRWLDGTTQTVALLRPTCDMSALFILQTFLPSRRKDCHTTPPKPHYPPLRTTFLPYERSACFASLPRQPLVSLRPAATKCG